MKEKRYVDIEAIQKAFTDIFIDDLKTLFDMLFDRVNRCIESPWD